jgi:hypothetical protein
MTVRIRDRFKKHLVRKHTSYGRTYNYQNGVGYNHYTKGYRVSTTSSDRLNKGSLFLNAFLERAFPKEQLSKDLSELEIDKD